jgi:hypothetical protein
MPEIINLGSLQLKLLQSKQDTAGSLDMSRMTLQPNSQARATYDSLAVAGQSAGASGLR